jgi:hypothetical protein
MRYRLLARAAALVLAAGGLLVIPASPASAHCSGHNEHPDLYSDGWIHWEGHEAGGTPVKHAPHTDCDPFMIAYAGDGINVHCVKDVLGDYPQSSNDWVYADRTGFGEGYARESQLRVEGLVAVPLCETSGYEIVGNARGS